MSVLTINSTGLTGAVSIIHYPTCFDAAALQHNSQLCRFDIYMAIMCSLLCYIILNLRRCIQTHDNQTPLAMHHSILTEHQDALPAVANHVCCQD